MARMALIDGVMRPSARAPVLPPLRPMAPMRPPVPPMMISPLSLSTSSQRPHVRAPGEQKSVSAVYDPSLPPQFRNAPQLMTALNQAARMAFPSPLSRPTALQLIAPAPYVPARPSPAIAAGAPVVARNLWVSPNALQELSKFLDESPEKLVDEDELFEDEEEYDEYDEEESEEEEE